MDGVLADVYKQFARYHLAETGILLTADLLKGLPEHEAFPRLYEHVNRPGFFRTVELMPHAQEAVAKLQEKYDVFIVSAAMEFPNSLSEKYDWLKEHFPFIGWRQIILCGSKFPIRTNIMIDDHFKNLDVFQGEQTFLFSQPHNILADPKHHLRVNDWKELLPILME